MEPNIHGIGSIEKEIDANVLLQTSTSSSCLPGHLSRWVRKLSEQVSSKEG